MKRMTSWRLRRCPFGEGRGRGWLEINKAHNETFAADNNQHKDFKVMSRIRESECFVLLAEGGNVAGAQK